MKNPLDTLFINALTVPCIIGVFENERKEKQPVVISIKLLVDTEKASLSDDIEETVNYYDITNDVYDMVSKSQFHLLEKIAQAVADSCLKNNNVKQVTVHIEKPQALPLAKSAAIEITRNNE